MSTPLSERANEQRAIALANIEVDDLQASVRGDRRGRRRANESTIRAAEQQARRCRVGGMTSHGHRRRVAGAIGPNGT